MLKTQTEYKTFGTVGTDLLREQHIPGVEIRLATLEDLDGMMRIEELCFGDERFDRGTVRAYLTRRDAFALVATAEDRVVGASMGMVSTRLGCGRIGSVAVVDTHRGKGIGKMLLNACEEEFRKRGITHFLLEVGVDNSDAVKLYETNGYISKGVISGYYSKGRDAFFMEKDVIMEGKKTRVKPS